MVETGAYTGRIALVTGGSRGLGRSTAVNLAQRGVDSIITYNSHQDEAREVVEEIEGFGAKAVALQLDVADSSTFDGFAARVQTVIKNMDAERFNYLVNNAGTLHGKSFEQTTEEELDQLYAIHFKGVFFLTQKLLPLIADGGRIVNISSGLARVAMPNRAAYGSIKGAVEVLSRYMAFEFGARGIAVNVVAPGAIATDFSGGVVRDNPDVAKAIASKTALGRHGVPDDVGPMIASLLSEDNRWVNAQRIEVSGGMAI